MIGVKDSSGELAHGLALRQAFPGLCILSGAEQYVAQIMCAGGSGSMNGLGNISPALMARIIARPQQVDAQDARLVLDLLALLSLRPGTNFVNVYKTMLAEQTGDDTWLNVRAPLCPLEPGRRAGGACRLPRHWRGLGQGLIHPSTVGLVSQVGALARTTGVTTCDEPVPGYAMCPAA